MTLSNLVKLTAILVFLIIIGNSNSVNAVEITDLIGKRVRLGIAKQQSSPIGEVTKCSNESIWIAIKKGNNLESQIILLQDIEKLEVSRGQGRNTLKGTLIGLVSGAFMGVMLGATSDENGFLSRNAAVALGAGVVGVFGAIVGTLVGTFSKTEKWEMYALENLHLSVSDFKQHTIGLKLSWKF